MEEQTRPMSETQAQIVRSELPADDTTRALTIRTVVEVPVITNRSRLSAVVAGVGERLPALWDGGRGPLAQAVLAGGMLALGSVVGRIAASEPRTTALGPLKEQSSPPPALPAPRRTELLVETAIVEARGRWGRKSKSVQVIRQRISLSQE